MTNPIQWIEIATIDIERAKTFYEKVFNLEFHLNEMPDAKMYIFGSPSPDVAGSAGSLVQSEYYKPSADGTVVYFNCEDVAVEASRVEEAGGKIVVPKTDIGKFGFYGHIIDTEGNKIGLYSQK